jgi:hypothetical protein
MLEEGVSDHCHERVMMRALPGSNYLIDIEHAAIVDVEVTPGSHLR